MKYKILSVRQSGKAHTGFESHYANSVQFLGQKQDRKVSVL